MFRASPTGTNARQPCRGPQVAERFVEALEEELVEVGRVVSTEGLFVRKVCLQCAPQAQECETWDGCSNPAGSDRSELAGDSGDGTEAKEQAWVVESSTGIGRCFLAARRTCEL